MVFGGDALCVIWRGGTEREKDDTKHGAIIWSNECGPLVRSTQRCSAAASKESH